MHPSVAMGRWGTSVLPRLVIHVLHRVLCAPLHPLLLLLLLPLPLPPRSSSTDSCSAILSLSLPPSEYWPPRAFPRSFPFLTRPYSFPFTLALVRQSPPSGFLAHSLPPNQCIPPYHFGSCAVEAYAAGPWISLFHPGAPEAVMASYSRHPNVALVGSSAPSPF
eukprot:GGOE01021647.1.p1 GENE.GGOE01021647.1~~GGOE01021647.1.p1  ORF type:complete len:164 (+),score=8.71 GGOE01021647.1:310-801(+)